MSPTPFLLLPAAIIEASSERKFLPGGLETGVVILPEMVVIVEAED